MRGKKLTVTLHIGGKQVETLTEEQREKIAQKFSETLSNYYSRHPEEYKKLKK
jgi:ABC-type transporter MlaC component